MSYIRRDRATLPCNVQKTRSKPTPASHRPTVNRNISRGCAPMHAARLSARARGRHDARKPPPPLAGRPPPRCARNLDLQPPRQLRAPIEKVCLGLPIRTRTQHLSTKAPRFAVRVERSERRLGSRSRQGDSPVRSVAQRAFVPSRRRVPARFDSSISRALSHTVRIAAMRGIQRARRPVPRTRRCVANAVATIDALESGTCAGL